MERKSARQINIERRSAIGHRLRHERYFTLTSVRFEDQNVVFCHGYLKKTSDLCADLYRLV